MTSQHSRNPFVTPALCPVIISASRLGRASLIVLFAMLSPVLVLAPMPVLAQDLLARPPAAAAPITAPPAPEGESGRQQRTVDLAGHYMVAAANPLAAEAGRQILRQGGSAVDAAIAIQLVLALVEPQSSGLGGGGFFLHFDAGSGVTTSYDGRETAPAAARPDRFLGPDGTPLEFPVAVVGGLSVGVPGLPRLLQVAHQRHGRLPWSGLFDSAIRLSTDGFPVSPRLNTLLTREEALRADPAARALYYRDSMAGKLEAVPVSHRLRNTELAATLRLLAEQGADAFYAGAVAADIVKAVTGHPTNPGDMTLADLAAYQVREREVVCGDYRRYRLCGMGPPSSGGIAVAQILAMMEPMDVAAYRRDPVPVVHRFAEAGRLAYADRALYLADPDFHKVPVRGLLDRGYLAGRAALITDRSMGTASAGEPPWREGRLFAPSDGVEHGTSHISVIDGQGNAVAFTTTIEDGFGARVMTRGFLLNNQLTDFSFRPDENGVPVANRVEPGKRPRSSMAPTLVFDRDGGLVASLGSPGGSAIINYTAKTLIGLLDWQLDPQEAVDLPNFGSRNGPTELEQGTEAEGWAVPLEQRGHAVRLMVQTSGTQALVRGPDGGLLGGADSRREGVAVGD